MSRVTRALRHQPSARTRQRQPHMWIPMVRYHSTDQTAIGASKSDLSDVGESMLLTLS